MREETFEFDDVLIKPIPSKVFSRDDVDISVKISDVKLSDDLVLKFPLVASPMVGVVDGAFAKTLSDLGGIAILHRFYPDVEDLYSEVDNNLSEKDNYGLSLAFGDSNYKNLLDKYNPKILLVDVANGYISKLAEYCEEISNYIERNGYQTLLSSGNVVTQEGCENLYNAGCTIIRVGIGGGSPYSTINQTGIGIPTLSAIDYCAPKGFYIDPQGSPIYNHQYYIMVDGGIRNSGDFVKAVVAGADLGMSGKLFAECFEAPNKGTLYGMASRIHMKNINKDIKSVEGFDIQIKKKHSLEQFVKEFGYGIKSAGTYLNARNLTEIYMNGVFVSVTDSAIKKGI